MEEVKEIFDAALRAEEAGDSDKALRLYEQASFLAPTLPAPRVRLAFLLHQQGKWKDSIRVGRELLKRRPRIQVAHVVIANSYAQLGRWRLAERFYRQALDIEEDANLLVLLSSAVSHLDRNDAAEECLRKALEINPAHEEAHYNLGFLYKANGEFALAETHLKRALEIDPKYVLAYAELGQMLAGQKDRKNEAVSLLRRAVMYNPDDVWSRAYLANALSQVRKLKAADEQYRRLLEQWPDNALPYWCYGDFLARESKDSSTAEGYLRKAVEMEPGNETANYYLGKHLLYWDRKAEGRKFLTKAARLGHSKASELLRSIED
jgi:protein O-GlcNAc transferase